MPPKLLKFKNHATFPCATTGYRFNNNIAAESELKLAYSFEYSTLPEMARHSFATRITVTGKLSFDSPIISNDYSFTFLLLCPVSGYATGPLITKNSFVPHLLFMHLTGTPAGLPPTHTLTFGNAVYYSQALMYISKRCYWALC